MRILLSQGKFAIVGPRDYTFLMQWKWSYGSPGYAIRKDYTNNGRQVAMHRAILKRMGFKNFVRSDHINRDRLDNRRCNLRPATSSQSSCNQNKRKDNSSGHVGVHWHRGKWCARISINRKLMHLKYCDDLKEAARVYNEAALKHHGEFAVLNEIL